MFNKIHSIVQYGTELKHRFFEKQTGDLIQAAQIITTSIRKGGKIIIYGNGGSAADAQHLAAEFIHRLDHSRPERPGIAAIALTADSSTITAIANDVSFENIFSRQVMALGKAEDIAIAISTSGNSLNVVQGTKQAKLQKLRVIGLLGNDGGVLRNLVDIPLIVPDENTPRVQEIHILIEHLLCELVEDLLCGQDN